MELKVWLCMCLSLYCTTLASSFQGKLLFSNGTAIMELDIDTRNVTVLTTFLTSHVFAMDYDYDNKYVYFPRFNYNDIARFQYPSKNTTEQMVVRRGLSGPVGIAVDSANDHIYWISLGSSLSRCNLDGTDMTVLSNFSDSWVVRIDVSNRWTYIVERNLGISKYRLDLTENQTIVYFTSTPVSCMDIDFDEKRLYWIDYDGDIKSAKVDGSDKKSIISTNVTRHYDAVAIGVGGSYIFYENNGQLLMLNKAKGSTPISLHDDSYDDAGFIDSIFVFYQAVSGLDLLNGGPGQKGNDFI